MILNRMNNLIYILGRNYGGTTVPIKLAEHDNFIFQPINQLLIRIHHHWQLQYLLANIYRL